MQNTIHIVIKFHRDPNACSSPIGDEGDTFKSYRGDQHEFEDRDDNNQLKKKWKHQNQPALPVSLTQVADAV